METTENYNYKSSYGSSFGNGWSVLKHNFIYLFLVAIILFILNGMGNAFQFKFNASDFPWHLKDCNLEHFDLFTSTMAVLGAMAILLGIITFAYKLLVLPIFKYGADMIFIQAARKIKPDFNYLIQGFKDRYLTIVLANLLTTALVMMGLIALIVPGIIIGCRLIFVSYLVMDKKLDPIAAIEESWRMTRGHSWTIFFMGLTSIFIFILGLCFCFVGAIPAIIWIGSSFACLYQSILLERMPKSEVIETPIAQ